jgi:hypothetical protein
MNNSQTASTSTSAVSSESGAKAALFAALNTGDGVTSRNIEKQNLLAKHNIYMYNTITFKRST